MRQRVLCGEYWFLLTAGALLGAVSCGRRPAPPPNYADGVTLEFDVAPRPGGPAAGPALTQKMVEQLLQRLDSGDTGDVRVQAAGPNRVEVWMEYPEACQKLWNQMEQAAADFAPTTLPATGTTASAAVSRQHVEHLLQWGTAEQYEDFLAAHPEKKNAIERYFHARHDLILARGDAIRDPDELLRLVLARGDLAFRIAVAPADLDATGEIGKGAAELSLKTNGAAHGIKIGGMEAKWYPLSEAAQKSAFSENFVVSGTQPRYMLCYDDPKASMTHQRGPAWELSAGNIADNPNSTIAVPFHLDKAGGLLMQDLSGNHHRRAMAILLDDEVLEAPTIMARLGQDGEITMGVATSPAAQRREAERMRLLLNAKPLNAVLKQVGKARVGK